MAKWCTVTVVNVDGRRHSVDVLAESSYDAAHLYHAHAVQNPSSGLPRASVRTQFEVVIDGKVLKVAGHRLNDWIKQRRDEWKGPRGLLFKQRPLLD